MYELDDAPDCLLEDAPPKDLVLALDMVKQLEWGEATLLTQFNKHFQTCPRSEEPLWKRYQISSRARSKQLANLRHQLSGILVKLRKEGKGGE